jgi:hypothetical protein
MFVGSGRSNLSLINYLDIGRSSLRSWWIGRHSSVAVLRRFVLSHARRPNVKAALPTASDLSGNIDGTGLRHGDLPCSKAGAEAGLSAIGGRAGADHLTKIRAERLNSQLFRILAPWPLAECTLMHRRIPLESNRSSFTSRKVSKNDLAGSTSTA